MDHDLPPELAPRRDELLARVTKRGRALRARRLGVLTTMLLLAVGVPIAAFAVVSDGGDNPHVSAVAPTTNVSAETPTTRARRAVEVLSVVPAAPRVGEDVTFTVRSTEGCSLVREFGDGSGTADACAVFCSMDPSPPNTAQRQEPETTSFGHVYTAAGDFTAKFTVKTVECPSHTSREESATVSVHVVDRGVATTVPTRPVPPSTQTTVPACRNSTNPACGPFRYDPEPPPNQPMTVTVGHDHPDTFRVGEPVHFTIEAIDPDAKPPSTADCRVAVSWGDGDERPLCTPSCAVPGLGPWDPPGRRCRRGDVLPRPRLRRAGHVHGDRHGPVRAVLALRQHRQTFDPCHRRAVNVGLGS